MAAYGAAVSFLNTLSKLKSNPDYPYRQIALLLKGGDSLKQFLVDNREVKREIEIQIRDAFYKAQDMIDTYSTLTHFLFPSEVESSKKSFYEGLELLLQFINSIAELTIKEFYHLTLDRKISASVWRSSDEINCQKKYPVVGRDKDINELKDRLMKGSDGLQVVPIVGIAGMGKTALAHCILQDMLINEHFDAICWVKVSLKYDKHDKLLNLLASLKKLSHGFCEMIDKTSVEFLYSWSDEINQKTNDQLEKHIYHFLKHKRYLVLLDDIRDVAAWNDFKELFPNYSNGSRILLTTRNVDVAPIRHPHLLDRLSDEDTMTLLEEIVFDGVSCPEHLAIIAKDIVQSCRGFPHAVVIVGKLLSCANPFAEYWEIVFSSINTFENYGDLLEALVSLTYNHLPQQLKVFLLYIAIFPYDYAIPSLKLMMQWVVEGFLEEVTDYSDCLRFGVECLEELCLRGFLVVLINREDFSACFKISEEVFHDFFVRKAKEEKFFRVINKDTINFAFLQGDTSYNQQRRLCIQQNIHRFIKDLSECKLSSSARSLIFFGPEPQYRLQAWTEDFKLLEVLDALKIGFYTFPPEFLKLFQLKYLAFCYNRQLPEAVHNFRNLQVLIVSQYLNLKCYGVPSYLPVEIWYLKDLMLLQVPGSDLPEPPSGTNLHLEKLLYLLDVSARSCTPTILERIKKIWVLEVQIQSPPEDDESLSFLSYLGILNELVTFKCIVMYPDIGPQVRPFCIPTLPSTLKFLTLSGCVFPWEYMRVIAALPELQFLQLQSYAFQGPDWEVKPDEFPMLTNLTLEDMDFENWTFASSTGSKFPILECLIVRHCYKLRHIPSVFADCSTLKMLEVVDCSTSAMNSALKIKEEMLNRGNCSTEILIDSSRDD